MTKNICPWLWHFFDNTIEKLPDLVSGSSHDYAFIVKSLHETNSFSVGWLISTCVSVLSWTSSTLTLLRDLTEEYSPLQLLDDSSEINQVLSNELGSTFQIEVAAKGVPTPTYQWMKLPCGDDTEGTTWENTGQTKTRNIFCYVEK